MGSTRANNYLTMLIDTVRLPLRAKKTKCHKQELNSRTGTYMINLLLTAEPQRHITLIILPEYDTSARHEELKRKMFDMSGGGDVGQLLSTGMTQTRRFSLLTC